MAASRRAPATLERIARDLARAADALRFGPPVTHVYDPLDYAWHTHRLYLRRYGGGRRQVLLLGMNPGPFGMAQTGVPFGEVTAVRDWLGIEGPVGRPARQHAARPVEGFACRRSEVSGARLWGWARQRFGTPRRFFARFFVWNYCPLAFMAASGRNVTPDKLGHREREALFAACDAALRGVVGVLKPRLVVGVGAFAAKRARAALAGHEVPIGSILHPSPASPAANRGWVQATEAALERLGVALA